MNFWIGLALLFVLAGGGAKVLDLWLRPTTKRQIHKKILNLSHALEERDHRVVIQAPIRAIARGLSELYGEALFSFLALRRCTSITLLVFGCALVISAVETGPPFSLDDLPWRNFDRTFNAIESICKNEQGPKDVKTEVKAIQMRACQRIRAYNNSENRIAFSVLFFPSIVAVAVALNFASMTFTRQVYRDLAAS